MSPLAVVLAYCLGLGASLAGVFVSTAQPIRYYRPPSGKARRLHSARLWLSFVCGLIFLGLVLVTQAEDSLELGAAAAVMLFASQGFWYACLNQFWRTVPEEAGWLARVSHAAVLVLGSPLATIALVYAFFV